jgi:DNA repair exonuclease SbcCD ATPase subunit/predicted phosphodiesterase
MTTKHTPAIKKRVSTASAETSNLTSNVTNLNVTNLTSTVIDIGDFKQMIHLSDIHIRPLIRHDEYKQVFRSTMKEISKLHRETPSVIVVTGDIFDHKTVFRPETFKLCRDFLKQLGQIAPVLLIAGNHDMLEQNTTTRMDSLTPVIDDIQGVHYLKNSGLYFSARTNDCFVVSSLYDKQFLSCPLPDADFSGSNICLYHGDITGTTDDNGGTTRNRSKEDFNGFDAVLLGDIHKHQIFQNDRCAFMAYPGSLIQQNHGEELKGHGFLVWRRNMSSWSAPEHISVHNDYGFVDIQCSNGEWIDRPTEPLPKHCYARLLIHDCTQTQLDIICGEIKRHVPEDGSLIITKRHAVSVNRAEETTIADNQTPDNRRKEDEIELILEQAKEQGMDGVKLVSLHKEYQSQIDVQHASMSSAVWRPIWAEFKNLFGYGGGAVNYIRFKRGLTSITAGNACGKSSTVNALLFGIFGRVPLNGGTGVTHDVVNNRETGGYIKILLNHGGVYYLIERQSCKPRGKTQTESKYQFTCEIWESNLHGDKLVNRCDTRQNNNDTFIAELFGDLADFSLTNLLNKESSLDLISMTPSDQVRTLKSLFKMDVYDMYRDLNKKRLTELESTLTKLRIKHQSFQTLVDPEVTEEVIVTIKESVEMKMGEQEEDLELLEQAQSEYNELSSQIRLLESRVDDGKRAKSSSLTLEELNVQLATLAELDMEDTGETSRVLNIKLSSLTMKIEELTQELSGYDLNQIQSVQELETLLTELTAEFKSVEQPPVRMTPAFINKRLGAINAKLELIDEDARPVEDVQKDLDEAETSLIQWALPLRKKVSPAPKEPTDSRPSVEISTAELNSRLSKLLQLKQRLELQLELELAPGVVPPADDETVESMKAKLIPGIPTEFSAVNQRQLKQKQTELDRLNKELSSLSGSVIITDASNVVQQLCDCPLIDEPDVKRFGLTGDFRLVDDALMERIIVHFENDQEHQRVVPLMSNIAELSQQVQHLNSMKFNSEISKSITFLEHQHCNEDIGNIQIELSIAQAWELWDLYNAHEHNDRVLERITDLKEELQRSKASEDSEKLKEEHEELNRMIDYYDIQEELKIVNTNLGLHKSNERLSSLLLEQHDTETKLELQERWEEWTHLSNVVETYGDLQELANAKSVLQRKHKEIAAIKSNLSATQRSLKQEEERLSVMEFKFQQQQKYVDEMQALSQELIKLEHEVKPLTDYGILMGTKGIASKMLFQKISSIQSYINDILKSFTRYSVKIIFDDKKQVMNIIAEDTETGRTLSTARFSGYEKLVLQIAFKRALNKFSYNSKSSLMIIDESLDVIDNDNFTTKLPDVMNLITQDYSTCLVISQRDVSHCCDVTMTIRRDGGFSYLTTG